MSYETNSKLVKKNDIFVAIHGNHFDGHDYIEEAIKNGASKIIGEYNLKLDIPYKKVKSTKKFLNKKLTKENKKLTKQFKIIGITGTKGKTTSCMMIYQMLENLNIKCAYIGTLGLYYQNIFKELNNTTPDILTLNKIFKELKAKEITHIVMEVSSHSLIEKRINGINFSIAGFTNLSQDHLDFHNTMNNYLKAKLLILKYLDGKIILNNDDNASEIFKRKYRNYETYGTNSLYNLINYNLYQTNSIINFEYKYNTYSISIPYVGKHNVYNYLLAFSIVHSLGFDIEDIINITNMLKPIKGRNELLQKKNKYVVIDYAHSPGSVKEILNTYKELKRNKIITVIGCGGNRDKTKRPIMSQIAIDNSDYVIFTTDNPRDEDPTDIINDMLYNINANNYEVILNRSKAIKKGVKLLKKYDYLLILGKGHENYQIIKNIKYPFDDKMEAIKYLN